MSRRVSIVVPVLDNLECTRLCVESLDACASAPFELILVDNGSAAETARWIEELAARRTDVVRIRNERNQGFAFACNQGLAAAGGDRIVLLNNDVVVTPGWLERLESRLDADARCGLVGPMTNRASGPQVKRDATYSDLGAMRAYAARLASEQAGKGTQLSRLVGLCLLVRREVIDRIGGFDPCFFPGNFEDDDFCLRAQRAGFTLWMAEDAFVHHHGSATFRAASLDYARAMRDNWRWFCARHEHRGELGEPYPARHLALKWSFDAERDFVPLRHADVFSPAAPPLPLEGARGTRVLLFADDETGAWRHALADHLERTDASADVTLVLRIEPPVPERIDAILAAIRAILAASGRDDAQLPDVLADATHLPPARRGSLYTACGELRLAGSPRDVVYRREAEACGLAVVAAGAEPVAARA